MCGIFGLIDKSKLKSNYFKQNIGNLFKLSETRGREAAGIAIESKELIDIYKDSIPASKMLKSDEYKNFIDRNISLINDKHTLVAIGHTRLVTNGLQTIDLNNQPIKKNGMVVIHNGIVTNENELWLENSNLTKSSQVDSELIPTLIHKYLSEKYDISYAIEKTFNDIKGEVSIAVLFNNMDILLLATNTGSIYTVSNEEKIVFVSENYIAKQVVDSKCSINGFNKRSDIKQLKAGNFKIINLNTLTSETFEISTKYKTVNIAPLLLSQKNIEEKFEKNELRRKKLKRCTKCILPETMPFIEFDKEGVCNFCNNYKPKKLLGKNKLEEELSKYRSNDGSADCLVAFSGGRDSSYGLHLIKEEYGMNPIAYTYDWGMVTDIARRNQARMCGQLGVEHIWVSADIKQKRENIKKNIKAWLKKPDLGMIPLFMAGDKQFFWYANKTMEQTDIKLMIFSMNDYERTEFKTGFANTTTGKEKGKHYNLTVTNQSKILAYYGKQFLTNPYYLNSSIIDTLFSYVSYYLIKQDYLYLFDYINWDENELNSVLLDQYDWEIAKDTDTTWRIGDGTASFYNYIYYTVAGFSENDTFRSNQIRAGVMSREFALMKSIKENQPRWDSIRDYLNLVDISFDDAIKIIDKMKKLY